MCVHFYLLSPVKQLMERKREEEEIKYEHFMVPAFVNWTDKISTYTALQLMTVGELT